MVECELHVLCGVACTLVVQLDWTVATLKERIDDELSYPCYSQVLSDTDGILLNAEKLRDTYRRQDVVGSRFCLFLARIEVPRQLGKTQVQRAWEAFRINSTDCGDTIPQANVARVLQYMGIRTPYRQVEDMRFDNDHISFVNMLSSLTTRDATSASNPPEELVAEICCFSELAGVSKSMKHSDAPNAIRLYQQARSREGGRNSIECFYPSLKAWSRNASSKDIRENETTASSRLSEFSASTERPMTLTRTSL
eukprot:TRINITY_DN54933_c0_g1_i1.p1 TRINITY_DN54933_c0_g1~~TRINITY_DN54933_c0_g1_i1.p1  ORF type:complete len:253 (+),score=18.52 TRINITY_DN54933_c0_g1_i1:63-821(+)